MKPYKVDWVKVGQRIQRIRTALGLDRTQVAERIGQTEKYLSAIETGKAHPSLAVLLDLRSALQVELDDFFDDAPRTKPAHMVNEKVMNRVNQMTTTTLRSCIHMMDIILDIQK